MSEHRGHEKLEVEEISDMVDHISNLPNCILDHILSFMPTKEVVKTSILSTRWKNLWTSVPNIDFDDELLRVREVDNVTSYVNFVERVLRLRDASNIEKFRLSCYVFRDASRIRSWISHAIMHKVQELDLTLFGVVPSVIPESMFDRTSLVSLKIRIDFSIKLPYHVSFPCLKTLQMSLVKFRNDDFTEKLFSGCPVLEELVLFRNSLRNLKNISISCSTLKRLIICDLPGFDPSGYNNIKVDAVNLTYFEYIGYLSNKIILSNTSSMDKSFIDILIPGGRPNKVELGCRAIDLLTQLQNVVSLRLSNLIMTLLFADGMRARIPVFPNLTHLTLTTQIGMNQSFRVVMDFLSLCPVLESICFYEGLKCFMRLDENNPIWSSIPICMTTCLKTVTLKKFHGYNSEICFLKCVLKCACALERMDIWWPEENVRDLKRKIKVMKKLEYTERRSTSCVIKFL